MRATATSSSANSDLVALYRAVKDSANTTYVVTQDLRIVRTNEAWASFAAANGGEEILARWRVGSCVLDAITSELRPFYREAFERALRTGERWEHDYECSSAAVFRTFRMLAFPVPDVGLVVTSSLRVERPHDRPEPDDPVTYSRDGVITMCASCRRTRAARATERWDWVPAFLRQLPPETSHGLCPPCARSYAV